MLAADGGDDGGAIIGALTTASAGEGEVGASAGAIEDIEDAGADDGEGGDATFAASPFEP